jgi:lipopolysaccharide biosynthesis regulator YciM
MTYEKNHVFLKYYNILLNNSKENNIDEFKDILKNRIKHLNKEITPENLTILLSKNYKIDKNDKSIKIKYEDIQDAFTKTFLSRNISNF